MKPLTLKGSIAALVTPFRKDKIDERALRYLVDFQITGGSDGILVCGTTGESPTLSHMEHKRVVEICIDQARGRLPVIAGTGSNSTSEAIDLTMHAKKAGADAALIVSPYYNKPTQEGLYRHFRAIAEEVDIPVILYNIASRTAVNIQTSTVVRLARDCGNIVGVKDASGSLDQMQAVKSECPEGFLLFSGDDILTLPVLSIGGVGVISVVANLAPKETALVIRVFRRGQIEEARALHFRLLPLIRAMFIETNPIPVKTAASLLGLCAPEMRLPLCPMSEDNLEKLRKELTDFGLLQERPRTITSEPYEHVSPLDRY